MELPAAIAAEAALARQAVSLSVIKQNAQADQAVAAILEQAIDNVPSSPVKGTNVNLSV